MSYRFENEIYTIWGNENAKYAADEILFNSEQVMVVKIQLFVTDSHFNKIENYAITPRDLERISVEYIHKANGLYYYIGKIERIKILKIINGLAEIEIVVLKPNELTIGSCWGEINRTYPCGTKNDICVMRKWPRLGYEKINKIIKIKI